MNASHDVMFEHIPEGPSNRSFGYTVGGILLFLAAARWIISGSMTFASLGFASVGIILVLLAFIRPTSLTTANQLWGRLGLLLFKIVNPVVMLLVYVTTFLPIGFFMRMRGHNPLAPTFDRSAVTYWIDKSQERPNSSTMRNQF